ncbi:unnamed protein product, partial [Closterium sp. NIES-53]
RDYELHSLDFSTAFLQGSLHEEIWLRCPPGFTESFPAGTQWSLRRPVYGLRQAPREWHDTLRTTLAALGFAPATADPSLFLRTDTSLPPFYVLVYVDDLVFATADTEALTLVLQRFGFQFSLPQPSPLSTSHLLSAPPSDESIEPSGPYPELVGCLMYLMTCTRPNLAYPLSLLARYVAPGRHRKLSSPVTQTPPGSSCEAEIYARAMAAQGLRWLTYLLTDLGEQPRLPPVLEREREGEKENERERERTNERQRERSINYGFEKQHVLKQNLSQPSLDLSRPRLESSRPNNHTDRTSLSCKLGAAIATTAPAATATAAPAATATAATAAAATAAPANCATMASLRVLAFDYEGRPFQFDTWLNDLQLYLLSDSKDSVSLFDLASGAATAPPATADSATRSQWLTRDAAARLAIRKHLPLAECAHFGQHRTAHALYDAVVARYSSLATAALGRLMLPYLFPELSAFATVEDLVSHLCTSDAHYHAGLPAEFLPGNPPPMGAPPPPLSPPTPLLLLPTSLLLRTSGLLLLVRSAAAARARVAGVVEVAAVVVEVAAGAVVGAVVEVVEAVEVVAAVGLVGGSGGSGGSGGGSGGSGGSGGGGTGGGRSGPRRGGPGGGQQQHWQRRSETQSPQQLHECFSRLDDAWHAEFGDDVERPRWADLLRTGVAIFDLDFDAILSAMYALSASAEGDCYRCVPLDPGIAAAALGASESSTPPGTAPAEALHTFTLDSDASRCFFRDSTTLTPLPAPIPVRLADPSEGPVVARSSTVLLCLTIPSSSLSGLHLPLFSTNLVSTAALQDAMVTTTTPGGQRVSICTCTWTGRHLGTFTRWPGSSLYTLPTEPPQVAGSAQVSASGQVAASCSCRLLSHQTLMWHHRLGHPSLPRLRGMHSRLLVSGLPRSLPPLPPSPAPPCLPCVEGWQRAAPHSSSFPPSTAPLQTPHMDVWGPAYVSGQGCERYFLLVVDDYTRYTTVFPLRSKGEVSDVLIPWIRTVRLHLRERFCQYLLSCVCTLTEVRHIGLAMEVACTSMIHAAAPHFLWPFAVRYAAHQLNLWPRVSLPETSPTLRWTGEVGDASVFWVWASRAFVRDTFTTPPRAGSSLLRTSPFDESLPFYRLFPYRSAPPPPPLLFLAPGPPPVDPLPPQGPGPSGVSQVDPLPGTALVQVAVSSGAAPGAASGGAKPRGAESKGAGSGGAEPRGEEPGGAEPAGVEIGDVEPGGAESEGAESGGAEPRATGAGGAGDAGAGGAGVIAGAGGTGGAATSGPGGAHTRGAGAAGTGGVGSAGAGDPTELGGAGAGGAGVGGAGGGGASTAGAGAVDPGAGGAGGTVRPQLYFVPLLQQVLGVPSFTSLTPPLLCPPPDQSQLPLLSASPLPAPSPYTERSGGLTKRREPASRPVSPVRMAHRVPRSRPPPVPGTHAMALRPSSVPLRVPLPAPPPSSLPKVPDPESDLARATSPTLLDFVAACRLDYATALLAKSASASPPSVEGECALGTDVLEHRQEDFECLAGAVPHFASMLLAPEGDPNAPDIPTPRSYAEAITGPYSSQWQAAMDAEMALWMSTGTY